jgi:hypothetical protein
VPTARNEEKEQGQTEQNEDWGTSHEAFHEWIEDGAIMPPDGRRLNSNLTGVRPLLYAEDGGGWALTIYQRNIFLSLEYQIP